MDNGMCLALKALEMPYHIRQSNANSINENINNEIDKYQNKSNSGINHSDYGIKIKNFISISDKDSKFSKESDLIHSPQSNVFILLENETVTLQTKLPVCHVVEVTRDEEIVLDFNEETLYYFETEIILGGYYDQIAIGITCNENYPLNELAGYLQNSVGYHGDDGKCYVNGNEFYYGVKFGSNDIIGCGITMSGNVYFTHNGCILPLLETKLKGNIYSVISLRGKYSSVNVNHIEQNKFLFKHQKQQLYKNQILYYDFSKSFANILVSNEKLIEFMHLAAKNFSSNSIIAKKFKIISEILYSVCKDDKKYLVTYFNISEKKKNKLKNKNDTIEEVEDEFKASPLIKENLIMRNYSKIKSDIGIKDSPELKEINYSNKITNPNNKIDLDTLTQRIITINKNVIENKPKEQKENVCKCEKSSCLLF